MSPEKTSKGGGKLNRTQTVTLRLDPKLRYLTEIAARSQRRTTSSFIEWAIEESLQRIYLDQSSDFSRALADEAFELWDVDEADRFIKLASTHPAMLTHEEQVCWKLINERRSFWFKLDPKAGDLNNKIVRQHWELIKAVANGEETFEKLDHEIGEDIPV